MRACCATAFHREEHYQSAPKRDRCRNRGDSPNICQKQVSIPLQLFATLRICTRTRRIAIVAMARKLLIALWRYVETGVMPEGTELNTAREANA